MKKICCICNKEFEGFGNNPYPLCVPNTLKDASEQRCCDLCNENYVISARILQMTGDLTPKSIEGIWNQVKEDLEKEAK